MCNGPDLGRGDHAQPADIVLLIEVSASSWRYDSGAKLAAYARGGLREVWLVDLNHDLVHVCRQPIDDTYTERFTVDSSGSLTVPETTVSLAVAHFLRID
jgi:Uma2 family endonuclease